MTAFTIAFALFSGSFDLNIPDPTNTPSAPRVIIKAASAMLQFKGLLSYGYVDYEGSGSIIDVPNLLTEVRGLVGYNINLAKNSVITPYIGLGYRHLNNDSSEMLSSTGAIGYERASNYYYSPIGFIFTTKLKNKWSVSFQSEYDYFIKGLQKSNLYDINPKYSNLKNNQNKGYGIRGFLNFQKRFDSIGVKMGPFIKYWNIKKSDKQIIMQENNTITYGIEPKNDSIEAGIKIELEFLFN